MNDMEENIVKFLEWVKENTIVKRISDSPRTMGELMWSTEKESPVPGTSVTVKGFNLYTSLELLEHYKKLLNVKH